MAFSSGVFCEDGEEEDAFLLGNDDDADVVVGRDE